MNVRFLLIALIGWVAVPLFYATHLGLGLQWGWLLAYVSLNLFFLPQLDQIFSRFSLKRALISLIVAGAWVYSSHTHAFSAMGVFMWSVTLLTIASFTLSLYVLLYWLEQPFSRKKNPQPKWWWGVIYGLIPALVWLIYLLTYSPGKMTYDSFWQWDMAHRIMPYNAWHPILHTWLIQASAALYNSPAAYSILQIVLVSAVVGYALYNLQTLGVPMAWVAVLDMIYAVNPVNGFYTITMWKDIPFAAFILLLTVLFAKIVFSKGAWLNRPAHIITLIAVAFVTMNLRDNGAEVVLAALILFIVFVKGARQKMTVVAIPVLILYLVFNGPVMAAFHVIKNPLNQALAIPSQQIAATYTAHGRFTPELKQYFNQILPEENWVKDYKPYDADPIKHDPVYNSAIITKSFSTYLKNWVALLALNPVTFVKAYLNQVAAIWQFHSSAKLTPYFTSGADLQDYPLGIKINAPNHYWQDAKPAVMRAAYQHYVEQTKAASPKLPVMSFGDYEKAVRQTVAPLTTKSILPQVKPVLDTVFATIEGTPLKNYLLKGAIPLMVLVIGLAAAFMRRGKAILGIFLPAGFVLITIAMAMPAPDFRYSFSFIFTVPFLFLIGKLEVD